MSQVLIPLENYTANQSYRRQDNGQKDYRSLKIERRMIEIRDHMGPAVWLLPPNFVICKIEEVPDEEEVVTTNEKEGEEASEE